MKDNDAKNIKKQILSLLLLVLLVLSIMSPFFNVLGIPGDIGASSISTYEWDGQEGRYPDAVRINNSEYYLVAFGGETGTEFHGYLRTIQVWDINSTIRSSAVSSYEFCATRIANSGSDYGPKLLHIPNTDKYAIAYSDFNTGRLTVATVKVYDSNGTISASLIDSQQLTQNGTQFDFLQVTGHVYVVGYDEPVTYDGWLETIWINDTGTINDTVLDTQEFDPTLALYVNLFMLDKDTVLISYQNTSADGNFYTWDITNSTTAGNIASARDDNWEFDTADNKLTNGIQRVDSDTVAIFYTSTSNVGKIGTVNITNAGVITKSWAHSLSVGAIKKYCNMFTVDYGAVYGMIYIHDTIAYQNVSTINISGDGTIGASFVDTLAFDTTTTAASIHQIVHINGDVYLIVGMSLGADGWAYAVDISTSYLVDAPELRTPQPATGATGEMVQPRCNITTHDVNGGLLTVKFYAYVSGAWVLKQTNSSVAANNTYRWDYTTATSYSTTYNWKVEVSDGTYTNYSAYNFTTSFLSVCYVSSSTGDNGNPGTMASPWQTIGKVNTVLTAGGLPTGGDIYFKCGDTWDGTTLHVKIGGTSGNWMTIGSYGTGINPNINGTTDGGIVLDTTEVNYVKIENFRITNDSSHAGAISLLYNHSYVHLYNISLKNIYNAILIRSTYYCTVENCTAIDCSNAGIYFYGVNNTLYKKVSWGKILNTTVTNASDEDCFGIHDGDYDYELCGSNFLLENCIGSGALEQGFDCNSGENVVLKNCRFYYNYRHGISIANTLSYYPGETSVHNVTFINCSFDNNTGGPSPRSVGLALGDMNQLIIRNCIIYNNDGYGSYLYGVAKNATIYNNDFIHGPDTSVTQLFACDDTVNNITVKNNIFTSTENAAPTYLVRYLSPLNLTNTHSNYSNNIYYRVDNASSLWYYGGATQTWTSWSALTRTWYEKKQPPLLGGILLRNFSLNSTSPCIDAGDWLTYTNGTGTGTIVTLDNARYFYDGYDLTDGDIIQVGTDKNLKIMEVNYNTKQITVNRSFTWADNDHVSFIYSNSAPDIGALEYTITHILYPVIMIYYNGAVYYWRHD